MTVLTRAVRNPLNIEKDEEVIGLFKCDPGCVAFFPGLRNMTFPIACQIVAQV